MTKRIKGWIIKRPDNSVMELEYILQKQAPMPMYRLYTSKEDANKMSPAGNEDNIKEAMLIYRD